MKIKQRILQIDPGFGVATVIALLVLWPFLSRASLPQETDAELHIFRLMELSYLVRNGILFPRWAPDFYHGYGYPIFNYYAPLTYYVGLVVELMPRLDAVDGIKFVFVLGLLLSAWGMYGFVRNNWGRAAGYVATAVYIYAPYIQFIDPYIRGVAPESFSFGVFAMALYCLDRLRRRPSWARWLLATLWITAVILSHNLMALLFFGILAGWAVWHVGLHWRQAASQTGGGGLKAVGGALLLGLGIATFFWLPVILERNAVNLNTLIGNSDNYDFRTHFLSLKEMFAFSSRVDWGATEPVYRFNLGVAQWLLGGVGLLLLLGRRTAQKAHLLFFAIGLGVLIFLQLPISQFVWEATPILPFFQFPWRLLGPTSGMLAILAGAGTAVIVKNLPNRKAAVLTTGLVALPILLALPLSQPAPWGDFGEVSRLRLTIIEQKGRWLGTTSTSDYIPATVADTPPRNPAVVLGFYEDGPLDRVNRPALPAGTVVDAEEINPLYTRYTISSPEKFRLRLFQFDFPGWQVTIDGRPAKTELGLPEGFLVVVLPAGEYVVDVFFGSTPARTLAGWITGASLLLTAVITFILQRKTTQTAKAKPSFGLIDKVVLIGVGVITAVVILIIQPAGWLHDNSSGNIVQPAQVRTLANFGQQINLLGYDSVPSQLAAGDQFSINLYWKAQQPLEITYQSFVHLLASDGTLVAQSDHLNPGNFPTRRWNLEKYVRDEHFLQLPPDLPPGTYTLTAGLWVQAEGWRLPLLDEAGQQIDDVFTLDQITITD